MSEPQKEAFRKYLESAGVIDALTSGKRMRRVKCKLEQGPVRGRCRPAILVVFVHERERRTYEMCLAGLPVLVNLYEEPDKPKVAVE